MYQTSKNIHLLSKQGVSQISQSKNRMIFAAYLTISVLDIEVDKGGSEFSVTPHYIVRMNIILP